MNNAKMRCFLSAGTDRRLRFLEDLDPQAGADFHAELLFFIADRLQEPFKAADFRPHHLQFDGRSAHRLGLFLRVVQPLSGSVFPRLRGIRFRTGVARRLPRPWTRLRRLSSLRSLGRISASCLSAAAISVSLRRDWSAAAASGVSVAWAWPIWSRRAVDSAIQTGSCGVPSGTKHPIRPP